MAPVQETSAVWWVRSAELDLSGRAERVYGLWRQQSLVIGEACLPTFRSSRTTVVCALDK